MSACLGSERVLEKQCYKVRDINITTKEFNAKWKKSYSRVDDEGVDLCQGLDLDCTEAAVTVKTVFHQTLSLK